MPHLAVERPLALVVALAMAISSPFAGATNPSFDYEDHFEFEASLNAPYVADTAHSRDFAMHFRFPGAADGSVVGWRLEILDSADSVVRVWRGEEVLQGGFVAAQVPWSDLDQQNRALANGIYRAHMSAYALPSYLGGGDAYGTLAQRVDAALSDRSNDIIEQDSDVKVGYVLAPAMPEFAALPVGASAHATAPATVRGNTNHESTPESVAATANLPYTVYLGNLHSQTSLSDGSGYPLSSCNSEQNPQSGTGGNATAAYTYAMNHGLDFLMTSEHNHMFDGSTSTNTSADPTSVKALYQSGQTMMNNWNASHSTFLALAGMEWGVISNGGHMNVFNADKLVEWEYNSSNQLLGDIFVAKSDYASMYTTMKNNGWIGQFNHPASTGQFTINGTDLAYTADGDAVMVSCEIMNSSAFSNVEDESQGAGSGYAAACNKLLEAGYHVAFSSDQDNHCANWGASYSNRTGVLIPNGQALNRANFLAALQARHVFATWDKTAQIVLTTDGGHIMGDQFSHSGALTLTVNYAPGTGRSASTVKIYQGVPGSNGTVTSTTLNGNTYTTTPANGSYFYYAVVTQDNGTQLYSAPVWVNQGASSGDTTPPTVSASESGSSGSITLSASASDNVGVSKVEFYVDGSLVATDTASPYSTTVDSTTLSNGSHSLVAKAYDAAGNVGTSSTVSFSVSNSSGDTTPPTVSATESGSSGTITLSASASDNVGVTKVEFYVDGTLVATDTASPYSTTYNSTALANGSHNLVAKAYDAAGNVGTSSTIAFSVSNTTTPTQLITNGGFESGSPGWTGTSGVITNGTGESAHAGSYYAWLDGYGAATTDTVKQSVSIPSTVTSATLSFWLHIDTAETTTSTAYDKLTVQLLNSSGTVLTTLATYSNLNANSGYTQKNFDVSAYKGQTVQVYFKGVEDSEYQTSFVIDDVSLLTQ